LRLITLHDIIIVIADDERGRKETSSAAAHRIDFQPRAAAKKKMA
jgi:hypothetical protein